MTQYKYTLLKQDGSIEDLGISKKKEFSEFYEVLECSIVEIIPHVYYANRGYGRCTMYGDEEGRFNSNNHTNPHFEVLHDAIMGPMDVVGDIIKEEVYHGR